MGSQTRSLPPHLVKAHCERVRALARIRVASAREAVDRARLLMAATNESLAIARAGHLKIAMGADAELLRFADWPEPR